MNKYKPKYEDVPPIRLPKRMSPSTIQQTIELFRVFREGEHSVRELSRIHNISFSTLRDRFRSLWGLDYTSYRSGEGTTYSMIKEHIDMLPIGKHKDYCKQWLMENRVKLLNMSHDEQAAGNSRLYTKKRLDRESIANCRMSTDLASSPFIGDDSFSPAIYEDGEYVYLHSSSPDANRKSF